MIYNYNNTHATIIDNYIRYAKIDISNIFIFVIKSSTRKFNSIQNSLIGDIFVTRECDT